MASDYIDHEPRAMRYEEVRVRRREMLASPHMLPLVDFVSSLRKRGGVEVPDLDPCDGGINARVLFLFEKPGPMTVEAGSGKRAGSGFICRNNDDPTAEATCQFMIQANLPRELTVIWNVVPWWNGTRKVTKGELQEGVGCVDDLINLLPNLCAIVLVGKKAAKAEPLLRSKGFKIVVSDHPSPLVRAKFPDRWRAIPEVWSEVRPLIRG